MAEDRKAIHAYLTPEAHDAIHDFAAEEGISVSGLLEAFGGQLAGILRPDPDNVEAIGEGDHVVNVTNTVRAGRKIDAQRRRRSGS